MDVGSTITSFQFPGSLSTQALGVINLGEIIGDYLDAGGVMHGFLDNLGAFTTLDPTGSTATTINGINDEGTVVGFYVNATGSTIGTVGTPCPSLPPCCSSGLDCSELVYCAAGAVKHFGARFDSLPCGSRMPMLNTKWEQVDDL
jgi:hypothetical protein